MFAPTNTAFMNLPMKELEELITDPRKLSKLVLNHIINRTIFSAGLHSHQTIAMANGNKLNLFAREGKGSLPGKRGLVMGIFHKGSAPLFFRSYGTGGTHLTCTTMEVCVPNEYHCYNWEDFHN